MSVKYFRITARTPFACEELIDYAKFEDNAAGALLLDELCDIRCFENADNWYNCHSYELEGFESEEEYHEWYYSHCDVLLEEITYEEFMYERTEGFCMRKFISFIIYAFYALIQILCATLCVCIGLALVIMASNPIYKLLCIPIWSLVIIMVFWWENGGKYL